MNRRKAREYALQMLFQHEFAGDQKEPELIEELNSVGKTDKVSRDFARELVSGTLGHLEEIDGVLQGAAENWDMKRMAAVDRNILRFAAYEIVYRPDIPVAVTINEALEIAKKYSSQEAASFINGLLDKIAHTHGKAK